MGKRLRKLKKIRLHHEGKSTLLWSAIVLGVLNFTILHIFESRLPFDICITVSAILYAILLNFFQCPIRTFEGETEGLVLAPADGKVVVVEETEENEYFHDRRIMVSIFMSLFNVHANWIPVDGTVKEVRHYDGNFHKAWLPKASEEKHRRHRDPRRNRNSASSGSGCYGSSHRHLSQRWRGLLCGRASWFHQVRLTC